MSKKYIFISILMAFLLIATGMNSVYGSKIQKIEKNKEKTINVESLKNEIKEKINSLPAQNLSFYRIVSRSLNTKSNEDPDGPYVGGLDDPTDYTNLFWGLLGFVWISFGLNTLLNAENLKQIIGGLLGTITPSFNLIMQLGEAFDVIEYIEDGC